MSDCGVVEQNSDELLVWIFQHNKNVYMKVFFSKTSWLVSFLPADMVNWVIAELSGGMSQVKVRNHEGDDESEENEGERVGTDLGEEEKAGVRKR